MRYPQFAHQKVGTDKLIKDTEVFLFDEPGLGKSKQSIDAACQLYQEGKIDAVVIVAPASLRGVWAQETFGEIEKHYWLDIPIRVTEYKTGRMKTWTRGGNDKSPRLSFVVTNYEFIRDHERLDPLLDMAQRQRTMLVLDETSAIKNWQAQQTKACEKLRAYCNRVVLLNGTPGDPADLFSQSKVLNPHILGKNWFQYRSRYAKMGGWKAKQIVGWRHVDEIQQKMAPYVLMRTAKDWLDLPEKFEPTVQTVALTPKTWAIYKDMRDEMIAQLSDEKSAIATHAATKAMRLSQITSGFVGGMMQRVQCEECKSAPESWKLVDGEIVYCIGCGGARFLEEPINPQEIGREKLDVALEWVNNSLEFDPFMKAIIWCRFRPELERLTLELARPGLEVCRLYGSQPKEERERAIRLLDPRTAPSGPVVVVGTPGTGSRGLTLTAANRAIYLSNDYSSLTRIQSEARIHRHGQTRPCFYTDVVAEGPDGQKTIDHVVIKALRAKLDLTEMTASAWIAELKGE